MLGREFPEGTKNVAEKDRRIYGVVLNQSSIRDPCPQALLIDFVGARQWQLLKKKNAARVLVGWSIGERKLLEIVFRGARARPQHDEGVWHLALYPVVKGHDQRLVHCGMALDQRLDRQWEDVL